jgi:hypothetical protein
MRPVALVLSGLLGLAACGPSAAEVREAKTSVYQTEFAEVWAAVWNTVNESYPRLIIDDPIAGRLVTDWFLIERISETDDVGQQKNAGQIGTGVGPGGSPAIAGRFFRIKVDVKPGGPPWRVVVDGEAAQFTPGMALVQPYDHGDVDEPPWVKVRIEKVRVLIHRKLANRARLVDPPKGPAELSTQPWEGLPGDAPSVLARIHAAAKKKDTQALRPLMIPAFEWSTGGEPSIDTALSLWSADPLQLSALVRVLEGGCEERETGVRIVCPKREGGQQGYRAELRRVGANWRFAAFYQE